MLMILSISQNGKTFKTVPPTQPPKTANNNLETERRHSQYTEN